MSTGSDPVLNERGKAERYSPTVKQLLQLNQVTQTFSFPLSHALEQGAEMLQGGGMCLVLSCTLGYAATYPLAKLSQVSQKTSFHRCLSILLSSKLPLSTSVTQQGSVLLPVT